MALESACIPIPSEVIMPFAGFLVTGGKFNFWLVVLVGALGNLIGSLSMYGLGFWGGEVVIRKLIRVWGKFILISEKDFALSKSWLVRFGLPVVALSRVLPVVRTFISLPAGVAKIDLTLFTALTFGGSLIWSAFLTYIGVLLGENWQNIEPAFRKFDIFIVLGAIILAGLFFYHKSKEIVRAR